MLFAGWEDSEKLSPSSQVFTIRTDPKPVNNFFCVQKTVIIFVNTMTKSHESITVARGQM